eukprot:3296305-Heterocapsa_arctica.AAC.1
MDWTLQNGRMLEIQIQRDRVAPEVETLPQEDCRENMNVMVFHTEGTTGAHLCGAKNGRRRNQRRGSQTRLQKQKMHHMCGKRSQQWIQQEGVWYTRKCHVDVVDGHEKAFEIQGLGYSGEARQALCMHCIAASGRHKRAEQDGSSPNVEKR